MSQVRNEATNVRPNAEFVTGTVPYNFYCCSVLTALTHR